MSGKFKLPLLAIACATALQIASLQQAISSPRSFTKISSEVEFEQYVVGKRINRQNSSFFINADGTITGLYGGIELQGNWEWDQGLNVFCLLLSHPRQRFSCKTVEIDEADGLTIRFRRTRAQ